jgi:hypothetical protein
MDDKLAEDPSFSIKDWREVAIKQGKFLLIPIFQTSRKHTSSAKFSELEHSD